MKRILLPMALLIASSTAFSAIDKKFNEESYEFKSLEVNTSEKEHSMSLLDGNKMIFLKDKTVYAGEIDTAATGINNVAESKALTDLGVHGTVAYDAAKNKIYFTLKESEACEWLYESTFDGEKWSKPKRLVIEGLEKERGRSYFLANAGWNYAKKPQLVMLNPTIAKSGNRIYFTSADIEGGKGGKDIWWIEPRDAEKWQYPVNAGETINTEEDEDFAFVENDEIIYVSRTKAGVGTDIFKGDANGNTWAAVEIMDNPYNGQSEDYNIIVKDGTPFIISNRGGSDDIWAWVKLPEPEPEPEIIIPELEPIVITFPWAFYLFDFDKSDLTERFLREIDAMVEAMKQLPAGTKFIIEGHTDQRGSDAYNDKLSLERANTVRDKLIEKGVNPDILIAKGYGKRRPVIADPQNEEEFYQNRRVVVDILKDDAK
ncbi:MAG: OmpA family protein [Paludibacteraceae bacterium]|nr:OmpA family protein [Paludibacteraceae bacterium]